jgi:muramoyltetrapeptide carboxypeptidase
MSLQKPSVLRPGDTIALVSPSAPMAGLVPHRVEQAQAMLEKMGFHVRLAPHALSVTEHTAGSAQERAADLQAMFEDDSVHGIMSLIGGNHSNQLLEHLDFDSIRRHPKVFVGYSDMTVLHFALHTQGNLVSFYGPAAMTQFADNPEILPYTKDYFERAVMRTKPIGAIDASSDWTDEILDWFKKKDLERPRTMRPNSGVTWLREGKATGPIIGGCITSMLHLRGTDFWPAFDGAILFWEIPESSADFTKGSSVSTIDAALTDLALSGVFRQISGMIIGRAFGYTDEQVHHLRAVLSRQFVDYDFPVLLDADIGHTDPMIMIPLGMSATLDSSQNRFSIDEAGVM